MSGHPSGPGNPEATPGDASSWVAGAALEAARELISTDGAPIDGALVIVVHPGARGVAGEGLASEAVGIIESSGVSALSLSWPDAAQRAIAEARASRGGMSWSILAVDGTLREARALAEEIQDWLDDEAAGGTEGPRIVRPR